MDFQSWAASSRPSASADGRRRARELYSKNSWQTRSAPEKAFASAFLTLDRPHSDNFGRRVEYPGKHEPDYLMKSAATTFGRGGIRPGQGLRDLYVRDPHTGVWLMDGKEKPWTKTLKPPKPSPLLRNRPELLTTNNMSFDIKRQPF